MQKEISQKAENTKKHGNYDSCRFKKRDDFVKSKYHIKIAERENAERKGNKYV